MSVLLRYLHVRMISLRFNFTSFWPPLIFQMNFSLEEISKSLHGFRRKFIATDTGPSPLIKTKSCSSAKINKLQQSRRLENLQELVAQTLS